MNRLLFRTLMAAGLISLSSTGFAGYGHGHGHARFMQFFDSNQDGVVTLDEFNESAEARFKRMDTDANGQVTAREFEQYIESRRAKHRQRYLSNIDSNSDGKISKEEYIAHKTRMAEKKFSHMDKDGDGVVNSEELSSGRMKKHGHRGGKRIFKQIDGDDNGSVTQQESFDAWSNWFERIDANGDKVVTSDEVRAYRERKWKTQ